MPAGVTTLATVRTTIRQRADLVNSQFITDAELNGWINSSYQELYDVIVQKYGDNYYVATPYTLTTDGTSDQFALPTDFYKLLGVDLQLSGSSSYATLKPFNFADRNRYALPGVPSAIGPVALRYRLNGSQLFLVPRASAGQVLRLWYVPRLAALVNDTDTLDGVSGWEEYVVLDCIIKAKTKEESDPSVEMHLKQEMLRRIEAAAENRDAGAPATVSDVRPYDHLDSVPWWGGA